MQMAYERSLYYLYVCLPVPHQRVDTSRSDQVGQPLHRSPIHFICNEEIIAIINLLLYTSTLSYPLLSFS